LRKRYENLLAVSAALEKEIKDAEPKRQAEATKAEHMARKTKIIRNIIMVVWGIACVSWMDFFPTDDWVTILQACAFFGAIPGGIFFCTVNKSFPPVALAITVALVVIISVGSEISKYGLDTARFFGLILGTHSAAFAGACIGALISWIGEKIRDKSPSWDAGEQVESNIMTSIVWEVILLVLIIIGVVAYREDAAQKTAALQASEANTISVTSDTSKLKYMPKERKYETLGLRKEPDVRSKRIARLERSDKVRILREGERATVEGITSNWVYIEVLSGAQTGSKGWVFKGCLD